MRTFWRHLDFFINFSLYYKAEIADAGKHKRFRFNVQNTKVISFIFLCFMLLIFTRKSAIFKIQAHCEYLNMILWFQELIKTVEKEFSLFSFGYTYIFGYKWTQCWSPMHWTDEMMQYYLGQFTQPPQLSQRLLNRIMKKSLA